MAAPTTWPGSIPGWTLGAGLAILLLGTAAHAQWPQFGGPDRSFKVESGPLAKTWPESGPHVLYTQEIGDGYSTVILEGDRLYTMARDGNADVVLCLDAKSGKVRWRTAYDAPFKAAMDMRFGPGPHSTPALSGDRLVTAGCTSIVHCLDAGTGKIHWKVDLIESFGVQPMGRGYSASPLIHGGNAILPVGGEGQGIVAFKLTDGSVAWKAQDFQASHSSPILIDFEGEEQIVFFLAAEVIGLDPATGELLWSHPHGTQWGANIAMPVWAGDNRILVSSAYGMGARCVRLGRDADGKMEVTELWANRKVKVHHGNALVDGELAIVSSGDFGPAVLMGVNLENGEVVWQERGFAKATMVHADGKVLILDEDGDLALLEVTREGSKTLSRSEILKKNAWTAPTLVGTHLYVRDRKRLIAFELADTSG